MNAWEIKSLKKDGSIRVTRMTGDFFIAIQQFNFNYPNDILITTKSIA